MNVHVYQITLFVILLFTLFYLLFIHSLTTSCRLPVESNCQYERQSLNERENGVAQEENVLYDLFPKTIYRTNSSLVVSDAMKRACHDKWIKLNPGFTMKWYTNEQVDEYMKTMPEKVYQVYQKLRPGAFKADLWRMCILFEQGGYYFDSYATPMVSIQEMLQSTHVTHVENDQYMVSVCETIDFGIHQGVLMVTPKHPFILQCIDNIVDHVENDFYGKSPWDITGPTCFYQSVCDVLIQNHFPVPTDDKGDSFVEVIRTRNNFPLGENQYGDLSFYLFKFTKPMQHVKTVKSKVNNEHERVILKKKFSQLQHIYRKHLHEDTYSDMWKKRKVYRKKKHFQSDNNVLLESRETNINE